MFIQDVKSSNGTFVNGERLSNEGVESEPYELKSEDIVEFGIDIVSEDNKTVVHSKVSAKVYCVWNVEDAGMSSRELVQYYPYDHNHGFGPARAGTAGHTSGLLPMAMMSAGGKGIGLNFDFVLAKLQTELERSKETGAELQSLTTQMNDIQETLSGGVPPTENGQATKHIPPQFRRSSHDSKQVYVPGIPDHVVGDPTATIAALQAQLSNTQNILFSHKDRIKSLEALLQEHEAIKGEVSGLKLQMEESKHQFENLLQEQAAARDDDEGEFDGPDFGSRSSRRPSTSSKRSSNLKRSSSSRSSASNLSAKDKASVANDELMAQNNALTARLEALSSELERALDLSRNLQLQHKETSSTVKSLESKVVSLEKDMATRVADAAGSAGRSAEDRWEHWKTKFEEGWRKEREGWEQERERLRGVVREWEEASRRAQEEEEEWIMNARRNADSEGDDDDAVSDREYSSSGSDSGERWVGRGSSGEVSLGLHMPDSHPLSPRSASSGQQQQQQQQQAGSRRQSSSRLEPAIRGLRATAGEPSSPGVADPNRSTNSRHSSGGSNTPLLSGGSASEALDALRFKSARNRRAGTITGRKRGSQAEASRASKLSSEGTGKTKSSTTKSKSGELDATTESKEDDREDKTGGDSTAESDETAHENPSPEHGKGRNASQVITHSKQQQMQWTDQVRFALCSDLE